MFWDLVLAVQISTWHVSSGNLLGIPLLCGELGNLIGLDALLQAIESLQAECVDEIERRNARKAVKAAAAAQAAGTVKGFGSGRKRKQKKATPKSHMHTLRQTQS